MRTVFAVTSATTATAAAALAARLAILAQLRLAIRIDLNLVTFRTIGLALGRDFTFGAHGLRLRLLAIGARPAFTVAAAATAATAAALAPAVTIAAFAALAFGARRAFFAFLLDVLRRLGVGEFFFVVDLFHIVGLRLAGGYKAGLDADGGGTRTLARIAGAGAFDLECAARHVGLGIEGDLHAILRLDAAQLVALLVEDVERHFIVDLDGDGGGTALFAFLFQTAQHAQGGGFDGAQQPGALAMRAGDGGTRDDAGAQALARHFHQAELADLADLDAGTVVLHGVTQALLDLAVVAAFLHVDEVDHDQAGQVAQAQLAAHFAGGFQVGLARRFLDRMFLGGTARIHVDRNQSLGLVDDDIAARFQRDGGREHRVQLGLDMHALEQRHAVLVVVDELGMRGHQHAHEVLGVAEAFIAFHHHVLDILVVQVADDALDQVAFLMDAGRGVGRQRLLADRVPQAQQIVIVAPDLDPGAVLAGGTDDQAHAFGQVQPLGGAFQALAVGGVGDLAGDAAAARGVGHQHAIAAGQRQIGGEGGALVAAFFLDDLHQDDLAALDHFLDLVVLLAHPALRRLGGLQGLGVPAFAVLQTVFRVASGGGFAFSAGFAILAFGEGDDLAIGDLVVDLVVMAADRLDIAFVFLGGFGCRDIGIAVIVFQVFVCSLRLGQIVRAGMIDEHVFMVVIAVFGFLTGVFFGFRGGIQRHQRRHLGFAFAGVVFGFVFLGLLGFAAAPGAGDLEGLDIVFGAAAGLRFLLGDQGGAVGCRDLVIVGMDFGESQETLAVASIFDKGGLQRRLNARHFRKIDVALERPTRRGLEIEFFDLVTVENDDPGFFRVIGVDEHALGHGNLQCARECGRRRVRRAARGGAMCWVKEGAQTRPSKRPSGPGQRRMGAQI